ncbi:MAG: photosystem II protein Y [Geminocystis sp.]|nr:photosystem II protein Y [Geminocystis sp.]HIK38351.1 photosystem II protein Y [Geminocystis sp. M7585_C2015_104]MCS7148744.1 photosystem II protein Y [Geminocystis sp.]MCX8078382.1 photosystem II protein Y [Geminocystis sp.]MDW8116107.1 photosystem II protein Y [Geminocystis sp.]
MDWRLLIVLLPVLVAAGWAVYNIAAAAVEQFQKLFNKQQKA